MQHFWRRNWQSFFSGRSLGFTKIWRFLNSTQDLSTAQVSSNVKSKHLSKYENFVIWDELVLFCKSMKIHSSLDWARMHLPTSLYSAQTNVFNNFESHGAGKITCNEVNCGRKYCLKIEPFTIKWLSITWSYWWIESHDIDLQRKMVLYEGYHFQTKLHRIFRRFSDLGFFLWYVRNQPKKLVNILLPPFSSSVHLWTVAERAKSAFKIFLFQYLDFSLQCLLNSSDPPIPYARPDLNSFYGSYYTMRHWPVTRKNGTTQLFVSTDADASIMTWRWTICLPDAD